MRILRQARTRGKESADVGLGDRIKGFFSKKANPGLRQLEAWAGAHKGVEGFIEPRTATSPTTLLLVDRYGEHLRAAVREPDEAYAFCERLALPAYDAQVIGYPKRMRDFERRRASEAVQDIDRDIEELERRLSEPGEESPGR